MANEEFKKLIEESKEWVRLSKSRGYDFDSILAGSYNDPSHFIYEILQNAEDENAKEVIFELFENNLDIYHDGKTFDFNDIKGVTGIGISTKKGEPDAIGKFGVGFKSVFAITKTPCIFSGDYKIKIEDFVVPTEVTDERVQGTLIRLPFNHKLRSKEEVFNLLHKKLENIGLKTLLFLKNINEIKWQSLSGKGHYVKEIKKQPDAKKVIITSEKDREEHIVIERPITIENRELKVEVAYRLGKDKDGKEIIVPEPDSKLVVFFPTEKATYLKFIIQGPYKPTPNRADILLYNEQNNLIIEETGKLVAESLSVIKDLGYLNTSFLNLLPINPVHKESNPIYPVIYEKVKEKLLSEELLPTSDGKYTKAADTVLARGKELTEFLDADDVQKLFSKKNWLDTNITYDKTRELRDYLINELKVTEVDFENFAKKITAKFLESKSDEWMIDFYGRLSGQQSLWSDGGHSKGVLRTKPIIRLETGKHIAPFDDKGKVKVYLPAETKSTYHTIKQVLTENEDSLQFLKALGLTKPDLFAEIREFILPKYLTDNPAKDECYFEDFEKLLKFYEDKNVSEKNKGEFIGELSKVSFIDSVHNGTGENCLKKPEEIYFNDKDLKDYFDGYPSIYFVSEGLYEKFGEERLKEFFKEIGVKDKPRREIDANLSWEEKNRLIGNKGHTRDIHQKDYEYEGLEHFIKEVSINKSCLLWKLLLKNIKTLSNCTAQDFFKGEYCWYFQKRNHYQSLEPKFLKTLRQEAWLVDKNNNFRKPSDITLLELSDDYIKENPNIDILKKALGFKPDIYDQLPEDVRKRYEITKDIPEEELRKFASNFKKEPSGKDEEKTWTPEHEPDRVNVRIGEVKPDKIATIDLTGQGVQADAAEDEEPTKKDEKPVEEDAHKTQPDRQAIGNWGEKHVYHALHEEYKKLGIVTETDSGFKAVTVSNEEFEIVWLNKHSNKGKGCDFIVKKNGDEIEYIEVKAKTQEDAELIEVTGTQWEFARKLFEQNEGEKYAFYVVLNAGTKDAKIEIKRNPTKLWKEGRLYAHPVNFKL